MLRPLGAIKEQISAFFLERDAAIECGFYGDQLMIKVVICKGNAEHQFQIRNKFFRKDGGWDELRVLLEPEYLKLKSASDNAGGA